MDFLLVASTAIILIIILVVALERRDRRTQGVDSHTGRWVEVPKPPPFTKRESLSYVACYIFYFCLIAVSIASYFLWPPAILVLIVALSSESDFQRLLYVVGNLLIVLVLFGLLIAAEPYLRAGVQRRQLPRRFAHVLAALGGIALLALLAREIGLRLISPDA